MLVDLGIYHLGGIQDLEQAQIGLSHESVKHKQTYSKIYLPCTTQIKLLRF